jgi:hypothetical protein
LLGTTDGLTYTATHIDIAASPPIAGDFRLGISFLDANTVIGRQSATPAQRNARIVDVSGLTGTLVGDFATEGNAYAGFDFAAVQEKPLIALVNSANSAVAVYDITPPFDSVDPNPNIAVGNASSTTNANGNGTGQVKFGPIDNNTAIVYAMNTNNGIQAYTLTLDAAPGENANFDGDADVDGADFLTWQANYGTDDTADLATGDANDDGDVNDLDYGIWVEQFGTTGLGVAAAGVVPEPGTAGMMALAVAAATARRRRGG